MFRKNEGTADRIIRAILGIVLLLVGIYWLVGFWSWVAIILGLILIATAILGYCGLYTLLKMDTLKR